MVTVSNRWPSVLARRSPSTRGTPHAGTSHPAQYVAARCALGAVVAAARQARQIAAVDVIMREVEEAARYAQRPPRHMLTADDAYVTGPVYAEPALALGLVGVPVAAVGGLAVPALACGHSTFPDMRMAPLRGATSPS